MEQWELDEIKTYDTRDIQHDLPGLVQIFGMEDETVKAFIAELESRGVKPQLTERKKDKWYDKSVYPEGHRESNFEAWGVGFKDKESWPHYVDMISGNRWHYCWTRNRLGEVVTQLWFIEMIESDYRYFNIERKIKNVSQQFKNQSEWSAQGSSGPIQ